MLILDIKVQQQQQQQKLYKNSQFTTSDSFQNPHDYLLQPLKNCQFEN